MTKLEAHELLTLAREGSPVSRHLITAALLVTGDLAPPRRQSTQDFVPVWGTASTPRVITRSEVPA